MAANADSDAARLGAAVTRLERRVAELGAALDRQDGKLDALLARTEQEEPEGLPLHEVIAQLVRVVMDTHLAVKRIDRELERQRTDEGQQ